MTSKTLEEAERRSKRQLWTMKALTVVVWLTFFASLVILMRQLLMHRTNNIIDDIQIEQLAVVTLHLIEPKPRDQAVLEEQFRAALPRAFRLTRDFLDTKSKENDADKP